MKTPQPLQLAGLIAAILTLAGLAAYTYKKVKDAFDE